MYPFTNFNTKDTSSFSTGNTFNAPRPFEAPGPFGNPSVQSNNVFGSATKNISAFAPSSTNQPIGNIYSSNGNNSNNNNTINPFQTLSNYNNAQSAFGNLSNPAFGSSFNKPNPFSLEPDKSFMKYDSMKFIPKLITETVTRDNRPVHLQLRLQNLCGMSGYEQQSFEEVHWADYQSNRQELQSGSSTIKHNAFATPTNVFANTSKLPFSNTTTPTFGNIGEPKPNSFFKPCTFQMNNSPTLPSKSVENVFSNKPFTPQNNTFGNNLSTSTTFGFPSTMNNFGVKPAIENQSGQQEFPKLFVNQPEKNNSFTQQPVQNQMFFNSHANSNQVQLNTKPTTSGLPSLSGNMLSKPSFPMSNTTFLPTNQVSTSFNSNSFGQPLLNNYINPPVVNYKPNLPTFNPSEFKPMAQNVPSYPVTNFQNNPAEINNLNKFQPITSFLTSTTSHDNLHERMISLSQQYPTPPLLKGLTPLYEEINIPLNPTSNPETIERILQEQLSLTQKEVAKTPLRSRLKSFEAPLFEGLDFDSDGGNVELNRKKCPRRLFIPQFVPIEYQEESLIEETKNEINSNDDGKILEQNKRTFKPESTQTEPIVEKTSPKTKSDPCGFVKSLLQLTQTKKKDSVENFPILTESDIQLSRELSEKSDTDSNPAKIISTRKDYYTIPTLEELKNHIDQETGKCMVKGFTIGRHGFGNIYFFEEFDVTGINIDELVVFEHKEVSVYPNGNEPPVGTELNRRCKITLERVWPTNKLTKEQIVDIKQIKEFNFVEVLKRVNLSYKTEFVEYKPETGTWIFISPNFSSY